MNKACHDEDWLRTQYTLLKKSTYKIAKEAECDPTTVWRWLKEYKIKARSQSEAAQLLSAKPYRNREWLEHQYVRLRKNAYQIAKELECSSTTVWQWLKRHGIAIRSISESKLLSQSNHISLSSEASEFLAGELLGDGHIHSNKWSACYAHTSKYKEYLEYLSTMLENYGIGQVGRIYNSERFYRFPNGRSSWATTFYYSSRAYVEFKDLHTKWYIKNPYDNRWPKFIKVVPKDIELTPLVCKQWFLGDGCNQIGTHNGVVLNTLSFTTREVYFLIQKLKDIEITANRTKSNCIHISMCSAEQFLNFIGACPKSIKSIYGYKWLVNERV